MTVTLRFALLMVLAAAYQGGGQPLTSSTRLVRTLSGGETHAYEIALTTGQCLYVVVDQRGVDVGVTVSHSGRTLGVADNPNGAFGPESVAIIADEPGDYRLDVTASNATAPPGSYEIRVVSLRDSTPEDRDRVAALQAFAEGQRLRALNTAESRQRAIDQYQKALAFFRSNGDRFNEVLSAYRIAFVHANSSDFRRTLASLNEVLPLVSSLNEPNMAATVVNLAGGAYDVLGEPARALQSYEEALVQFRAVGNRPSEASVLNNIGKILFRHRPVAASPRLLFAGVADLRVHR